VRRCPQASLAASRDGPEAALPRQTRRKRCRSSPDVLRRRRLRPAPCLVCRDRVRERVRMRLHGTRRLRIRIGLVAALAALLIVPSAAAAVHITGVDTSGFPLVRVTVVGPKGAAAPRLRENGSPVFGVTAA